MDNDSKIIMFKSINTYQSKMRTNDPSIERDLFNLVKNTIREFTIGFGKRKIY